MDSTPSFARRHRWLALFFVALAIGLACGGKTWLLMLPAMFMLGRSYGSAQQDPGNGAKYGVGAALAGFTPARRD